MPRTLALIPKVIALTILVSVGCSGGDKNDGGSGGSSNPNNLPAFLLASNDGISEWRGDDRKPLVTYTDGSYLLDPAISPDGKLLSFGRQVPAKMTSDGRTDFGSDLYIADRDGKNQKELVRHGQIGEFVRGPAWLPDGKTILYSVYGRHPTGLPFLHIEGININGGQRSIAIEDALDPVLSPDGKSILYLHIDITTLDEELRITDLNFGPGQSVAGAKQRLVLITSAVWSPDGQKIAFAASDIAQTRAYVPPGVEGAMHPTLQDIWTVNRDGTNLRRLAELTTNQPSVVWSKDGTHLYALSDGGFWRLNVNSGLIEVLGQGIPTAHISLLP